VQGGGDAAGDVKETNRAISTCRFHSKRIPRPCFLPRLQLDDPAPATREASARALAALFDASSGLSGLAGVGAAPDAAKVEKLLSAGALKRLVQRVVDPAPSVRAHALGALRNILAANPPRVAAALLDADGVPAALRALSDACAPLPAAGGDAAAAAPSPAVALRQQAAVASHALLLLLEATEAHEDIADAVAAKGVQGLFNLLAAPAEVAGVARLPRVRHAVARLLLTTTDRNDALCGSVRSHPPAVALLSSLASSSSTAATAAAGSTPAGVVVVGDHPFTSTYAAGALANLFLQPVIAAGTGGKGKQSGVTRADAEAALGVVLSNLRDALSSAGLAGDADPAASLAPVASALSAARAAYAAVRTTAPAAREAVKAVAAARREARRATLRALIAAGRQLPPGGVEALDTFIDGAGGNAEAAAAAAAATLPAGSPASVAAADGSGAASASSSSAAMGDDGEGDADLDGDDADGLPSAGAIDGAGAAASSHPAVVAHTAALAAARTARAAYHAARRAWFLRMRRAGLALEIAANLAAGADEEVAPEEGSDEGSEAAASTASTPAAAVQQSLASLPPGAVLSPQLLAWGVLSSLVTSGLPQAVLGMVRASAATVAATMPAVDAPAGAAAAATDAIASLPQRLRRGVALSLLAVVDRGVTVLSNLTSALAAAGGADAAAALLGPGGGAAVHDALAALLQQSMSVGAGVSGTAGATSSLWLAPPQYSASALQLAVSAGAGTGGPVTAQQQLTPEELARIDANVDGEPDDEEADAAGAGGAAQPAALSATSASSSSAAAAPAAAAFVDLTAAQAADPAAMPYGDEDADAHALAFGGGGGADSGTQSLAQAASLVLGVDECLAAAFRLVSLPGLALALRHALSLVVVVPTTSSSSASSSSSAAAAASAVPAQLVLATAALALYGPVAAPLAGAGVSPSAAPDAACAAMAASPLAAPGGLATASPPLGALASLPLVKAAEAEARQHAVALLGALGSPLPKQAAAALPSFRLPPQLHAVVGVALGSIVAASAATHPPPPPLLLAADAADALIDAYAEDVPENDAAFAARGLAAVCAAAASQLAARHRAAVRDRQLDRAASAHVREVASNLAAFAAYKQQRR
jgi:trimeric autotransporter adhesin